MRKTDRGMIHIIKYTCVTGVAIMRLGGLIPNERTIFQIVWLD